MDRPTREDAPASAGGHEVGRTLIDLAEGEFAFHFFETPDGESCMAVTRGLDAPGPHTVRIHSACLFGESFGSLECDCRAQLDAAVHEVRERGGAILYMFQEGRGIGLAKKILAMQLQRMHRVTTREAFESLGFAPDPRRYDAAIAAMRSVGVSRQVRLITNNPNKIRAVEDGGYEIVERVEPTLRLGPATATFVKEKELALGHIAYRNIEVR